ncbi:hypothetical protein [Thermomonospora cellulosilytica]|uniref:Uncharacterized protein n=1 Tax=Thermomonospora cellulosilytica TaxID=1411118 RepID=A0A7W3MUT1_9ACTN|nr:hypothetical protein [Thermomonospora cellulosilytica]MBA9002269.1 hypothetical protein [Thermomonospora cellulosilytica]
MADNRFPPPVDPSPERRRNILLIAGAVLVILIAVAVLGDSDESADGPTLDELLATSSPSYTPSPTATLLTALSDRERAFLEEMGEEPPFDSEDKEALGNGWYACTGDDRGYLADDEFPDVDGPPTAQLLRDSQDTDDEPLYEAAITHLCPEHLPLLKKEQERLKDSFEDGTWTVGEDVKPGTYRTDGRVTNCYWERSTRGGDTIANDFVTNAPGGVTVTISPSDGGFTSEGCDRWLRVR